MVHVLTILALTSGWLSLQAAARPQSSSQRSTGKGTPVDRAIDLASKGNCEDALPMLRKSTAAIQQRDLKYKALMATVPCAMKSQDDQTVTNAFFELKRDFPADPEVLYMISQFFLGVAENASQELSTVAPNSYQTKELQADSLESQGKWSEAIEIYKKVLQEQLKLRGIHYRLGRAALSQPQSPTSTEDAKREFQQELEIDAAAEFWLGEIARQDAQWDDAVQHFGAAARLDKNFGDALLSFGTALNSAGRFNDAVAPLEDYVRNHPAIVAGHPQLYVAYLRTGRKDEAAHEMAVHQELLEKSRAISNARSTAQL